MSPNINFLLNKLVVVKRRASAGSAPVDVLNAPSYGKPDTWETVYPALKCRIEIKFSAPIEFKPTGERIPPRTIMFTNEDVDVRPEDRIYEGDNVWVVEGRQDYFNTVGGIHHYEFSLLVP